jgi:hypothetical protein
MFNAIVIDKSDAEQTVANSPLNEAQVTEGDVTIDVQYSTTRQSGQIRGLVDAIELEPSVDLHRKSVQHRTTDATSKSEVTVIKTSRFTEIRRTGRCA